MNIRWPLIGLLLVLFGVTGCKSVSPESLVMDQCEETRKAIRSAIKDNDRAAAMVAIVDSFSAETKTIAKEAKTTREQIAVANRDYDATRADMQRLHDKLGLLLERLGHAAKRQSLALRGQCSESEWNDIFSGRHRIKTSYF